MFGNPKVWKLIRSRPALAAMSRRGSRFPRADPTSARAFSRSASAAATVWLPTSASFMTASRSVEPSAFHHGPAVRTSGESRAIGGIWSPAMA